jgi:hypothetical protein
MIRFLAYRIQEQAYGSLSATSERRLRQLEGSAAGNLYNYVRNDPISRADADGHCPQGPDGGPACSSLGQNNPANNVSAQQKADLNAMAKDSSKKTADDKKGGNHETGMESYKDKNGNQVDAASVPGKAGTLSTKGGNNSIHVDPRNAADPSKQMPADTVPDIQAHAHPAGTVTVEDTPLSSSNVTVYGGTIHVTTSFWNGPPSAADIAGAWPAPTLNIVMAPGTVQNPSGQPTVYFFNNTGDTCQMPMKDFK